MEIKPITTYTGKVVPLFHDNIDTDQIIPKVHLKRISKTGFGLFAFDEWRYLEDGSENPDFNPNKPQYRDASILITIIAGSYSDIFYMNCTKNALLPIVLDEAARHHLAQYEAITIDLPEQTVSSKDQTFSFDIDPTWKHKFVNGLDDIAITLQYEKEIEAYEKNIKV